MRKLSLYYFDWLLLLLLVLMMSCVLCGTAYVALGSETPTWAARAAAAIAIHNSLRESRDVHQPKSGPDAPIKSAVKRPIVKMYSATWCAPCQQAKAELKGQSLPFELQIIDVSQGGQPDWCDVIPAFAWQVRGQTRYVLGFPGVAKLIATWKGTRPDQAVEEAH